EEEDRRESPSNISILSQDVENKGPLTKKYIFAMLHAARRNKKYHVYGARLENEGLRIGDSELLLAGSDMITIKDQTFKGTSGLFALMFKPIPKKYSKHDLNTFKNICVLTNSHRKGYSPNTPVHRNRSEMYKTVITKLFSEYR
uniref:hypothetical protein n=1 Tax=Klebsiella pneumoniae TaxID=573 RepID=UPI00163D4EB1